MRLTKLETKGFKSFGDKVTIHFDKGITAIVGPNGSGKSNVVDAIRWVLGEQKTRMLRSDKMENVIFNGTKNRKPGNLAEVFLTFENNKGVLPLEYSTVCIGRRLYRTGESEYLLNNVTCRLKDITDLFLDTGIGPDSYSIIELKMVDDIIKDRHSTINNLLEEAAGISKYKIRKKQTFNKLEETDADLNRVNDLLFEIEKSLKQLENQAKKTQKFYRLKDEYKELSVAYSLHAVRDFNAQMQELQHKETSVADDKLKQHVDLDVIEAKIQHLKTDSLEKEKALSIAQRELNETVIQITKSENEVRNIRDRISFLQEKQKQISQQNVTDQNTINELQESVTQLQSEKTSEEETLKSLESQLQEMKRNVDENKELHESSLEELNNLNKLIHETRQEINRQETEVAVKEARANSIREELKRLGEQNDGNSNKLETFDKELSELSSEVSRLEQLSKETKEKTQADQLSLQQLEDKLRELNVKLSEEKRSADVKSNEYELTKSLIEKMEGFPDSIRFLKSNESAYRNLPLLSDIISFKDSHKNAIENYLEPFLNHFIADNTQEAWSALQLLDKSSKGRAHFFVLDNLKNASNSSSTEIPGCVSALSVAEYDSKYNKLIEHLLGHVYVLKESEDLSSVDTSALDKGFVILSANGRFLRQRYSMGGGSVGQGDGKRTGRQKNLQQLSVQIQEHQEAIEKIQQEIGGLESDITNLRAQYSVGSNESSRLDNEFAKASGRVSSINTNRDFVISAINYTKTTIERLSDELSNLTSNRTEGPDGTPFSIEARRQELTNLLQQQGSQQQRSNELQKHVGEMSGAYNAKNIQFYQQQNKLQNVTREISFKSNQITNLTKNRENQVGELEGISTQLSALETAITQHEDQLKSSVEKRIEQEQSLRTCEDSYYKSKGEIDSEEKSITEKRKQKEHSEAIIREIQSQKNALMIQMTALRERLSIEFEILLDDLHDREPDPEQNPDELRARVEKLKTQLSEFGAINPMALESFKEIKERHDFILKEQDDLNKAKESLLKTIAEIDGTAKEKFMDAYNAVRANFIHVFRTLFSEEDNCDLILTDLANPLESDVQIIAQPKGKKPMSIDQLSGGEKTLTATSLLFGVYLLKPSPFCILDEVDAPLDDANIGKFSKIIRTFSKDSQFIIITHNKATMAETDVMYGVTMVEQGVTQLVPVDLREYA
jgi:chromosome segregation protein